MFTAVQAVILSLLATVSASESQSHAGHALGTTRFPVSCAAPSAREFERGLALLHHMTYPQARTAFEAAAAADPRCAIAHWGIAMTLFQPLWPTRPTLSERERGWAEVQRAEALQAHTERERLFIATAEAFFRDPADTDYWERIRRWEAATERAYRALPKDEDAAAFHALALLATTPPDRITRSNADRAAAILLDVHARNPEHPGAMHYLVHANDVPGRERESLDIVRRYDASAPRNPHALHMPTHIYTRLGEWQAAIRGNMLAADAALEHPAGAKGEYVWDEFAHAIEYLVYAYLQRGQYQAARDQMDRLLATPRVEQTFKTAFHLASIPARCAIERRDWAAAARLGSREPAVAGEAGFAWPEAITRFAAGMGALRLGQRADAEAARDRILELEAGMTAAGETLFARHIRVLHLALSAWLEDAAGNAQAAFVLLEEAAAIEDSTPKHAVTPGPTWPAHEQLGQLLLQQGRADDALAAYVRSLELHPQRLHGLAGAARASRAAGNISAAEIYEREMLSLTGDGPNRPHMPGSPEG